MICAPVIIPTLNRNEHLERLINSLKNNNTFASETEIYISVDYPPSDKYIEGYKKVCDYVKTISGFKSVYIYYQKHNLGAEQNFRFLVNEIKKRHDRYIVSEDDNEFSRCFLEYINLGLEKYKDDDDIIAICSSKGYYLKEKLINQSYVKVHNYSAYGVGKWVYKEDIYLKEIDDSFIEKICKSRKLRMKLFRVNSLAWTWVAHDILREIPAMRDQNDRIIAIDYLCTIYSIINSKYCVFPSKKMVRNWGFDGSGINCSCSASHEEIIKEEINENEKFCYVEDVSNNELLNKNLFYLGGVKRIGLKEYIRCCIIYFAYNHLNKEHFSLFTKCIKKELFK